MYNLECAYKHLKEAGWELDRKFDVQQLDGFVEEQHLTWFAAAREFLLQFGGLKVKYYSSSLQKEEYFCTDLQEVAERWNIGAMVNRYEACYRIRFFPIGDTQEVLICITENGGLWYANQDGMGRVGNNIFDFIYCEEHGICHKTFCLATEALFD